MKKELTQWADNVIETVNRPKFTQESLPKPPKKRKIIALAGFAQSGKDTVGKMLVNKGYNRLAFADAVRDATYAFNPIVDFKVEGNCFRFVRLQEMVDEIGWERAKTECTEVRESLQKMGTEVGREIFGKDCWTNIIKRKLEDFPELDFVITDTRFPNELELIREKSGVSVRVLNNRVTSVNNHVSDAYLEGVQLELNNHGSLEELEENVNKLLTTLK